MRNRKQTVKVCGLYEIVNTCNGKRYIGSSSDVKTRFSSHKSHLKRGIHHSGHLQNAWDKYGAEAFTFTLIREVIEAEKIMAEQVLLDAAFEAGEELYNVSRLAEAPMTGRTASPETCAKISAARTGKLLSLEHKAKIAEAGRGRRHSEETKMKIAAANKGKPKSPEQVKKMSEVNRGKIISQETRDKISTSNKGKSRGRGKKASTETRAKMSAAHKGRPKTPEHVAKVAASIRRTYAIKRFMDSGENICACHI